MLNSDNRDKGWISYKARYNKASASGKYLGYEKAIFFSTISKCVFNNSSYGQST